MKTADLAINGRSHEDARIAVTETQQAEPWIHAGQQASGAGASIEVQREIAADYAGLRQRFQNPVDGVRGWVRVGMQEPEHIGGSRKSALMHLAAAPPFTSHGRDSGAAYDLHGLVFAAAVHYQEFMPSAQL